LDQSLISYYIYRVLGALVPLLPPRIGYALFGWFGNLAYSHSTGSRQNVEDNLRHVLGAQANPDRIAAIARKIFRNQAHNYYDLFRLSTLRAEQIERLVTFRGGEHLDQGLSQGKGLVLVSAHFGNVDVVAQMLALRQYPVTVAAEHLRPEKLYQYVASLRASKGIQLVPADAFMRPLFRALHRNEIVGVAADRNLTGGGTLVEFFGSPALLPDGHVRIALHTGANLAMAFAMRKPDCTLEAVVEPPLDLERSGDPQRDVHLGMARVVAVLEKYIGRYPEQWVMFQPVWNVPANAAVSSNQDETRNPVPTGMTH